jgi:hypothetical protein
MRKWATVLLVVLACAGRAVYAYPELLARARAPVHAELELSAIHLAQNGTLGNVYYEPTGPTAHVSPLYPLVLAGLYLVCTPGSLPALLVQSALAIAATAAGLALLPWLARRAGLSETAGWLAAYGLAVAPVNYYYESFGDWDQPFAAVLLLGLVGCFLSLHATRWGRPRVVVLAGVLWGAAGLLQPSLLPAWGLMVLAELAAQAGRRRRVVAGTAGMLAVGLVLLAPWVVRNYSALGGFVPFRSNFGLELAYGNYPGATGCSHVDWTAPNVARTLRHPHPNKAECDRLRALGELAYMRQRQEEAVAWIEANPGAFARLTLDRFRMFWFPDAEMFGWYSPQGPSVATLLKVLAFGGIGALALGNVCRLAWLRHRAAGLFAAALAGAPLAYLITHVELRYRLPVHALAALVAADGAVALWGWLRGRAASAAATPTPASSPAV